MTMSEKDKNTIIIAVVALLIFGIAFLGIKPAFASLKETKATNAELSATKEEMKTEIEALPTYKTNLETAKAEYKNTADRVYGDLTNDLIHDAVVEFITSAGLDLTSLTIGEITKGAVNTYSVAEGLGSGGIGEGALKLTNISVTVSGTASDIINLVEKINETEGTYLGQISFNNVNDMLSVSFNYTMVLADSFE